MKVKEIYYLSYDGILTSLGYSQIFQYILILSKIGKVKLISYEKSNDYKNSTLLNKINKEITNNKISWTKKIYLYKNFKILHILNLLIHTIYYSFYFLFKKESIIHVRGYLPLLFLLLPSFFIKLNLVFDMRGYWHHEKVDRMGWNKNSLKFHLIDKIEKYFLKKSNKIICLTLDSKEYLSKYTSLNKIYVIPTCVNVDKFIITKKLNQKINLCYMGSTSKAYDFTKTLKTFKKLKEIDNKYVLNIFTNDDYKNILKYMNEMNIELNSIIFKKLDINGVIDNLKYIDFGFFFLKKNFSITASFPTKIGEYLASGTPIITNDFNSHVTSLVRNHKIGFIFDNQNINNLNLFIKENINNKIIINNCINTSHEKLSIKYAIKMYNKIYDTI